MTKLALTKRGGYRKAGKRASQLVLFYALVRQARMPKRLDLAGALRTAGSRLNTNIAASWPRDIEAL